MIPDALSLIHSNTDTIIGAESLKERLAAGKKLRVKLGVDPTRPDLTFGHAVVFNKLRQFQQMGHQAILLIGDYTATIGDPSGRSATRPALTEAEVETNAKTYLEQAFKILDRSKTEIRRNSEWFKEMSFGDSLNLARKMTVARMLERDDFSKRYKENSPISIVEFLYPLVQGYDSIMLEADVEIGGTDQLFNLLVGRALQKEANQLEQIVVTMPLLIGLDGEKKMSKSLDNYIAFNDSPKNMFGKVMSISDATMWDYYRLLLNASPAEIKAMQENHPMVMKKALAQALVGKFHSPTDGERELAEFESVFSKGNLPETMPEFSRQQLGGDLPILDLLSATGLFPSKKEIRRLIEQGAIKVDGEKIGDPFAKLGSGEKIFQSGKRTFFKIN